MDLVGFGLTLHDSSVAAYKDGKFLYRKAERQFNQKHAHGNVEWAMSVLNEWGIDKCESAWSEWLDGDNPQKIKEGNKLDHHYTHALSSAVKQDYDLVLDQGAFTPGGVHSGLAKVGNRQAFRYKELAIPNVLYTLARSNQFEHQSNVVQFIMDHFVNDEFMEYCKKVMDTGETPANWDDFVQCIDIPGKIMSLQSYGKPSLLKVEQLMASKYRNYMAISMSSHTPPNALDTDFIATIHKFCEEICIEKAPEVPFHYSGGVAQNVVINRAMLDCGKQPTIYPWAYDGGCSIGALNYLLDKHDIERNANWVQDDEAPVDEPTVYTIVEITQLLHEGKVVGWYQGNGEVGPRALGNRSILFNPADPQAKEKVNKIKQREWWRPFGASVLEEKASQFFDLPVSRHMLFNSNVLYSGIPGVTHVDGTCRHQTVPEDDSPFQWLLTYYEQEAGIPVLLNTSLNEKGKPLCSTIEQAIQLFKNTEMDALCVGDTVYKK